VADLRRLPEAQLVRLFGVWGTRLYHLARGEDDRQVEVDQPAKSVGAEETFAADLTSREALQRQLLAQAEKVAARLRRQGLEGRVVTLKVRYDDFKTVTRRQTLAEPTASGLLLYRTGLELLVRTEAGRRPVRLLGLSAGELEPAAQGQATLFPDERKRRLADLDRSLDRLAERFGASSVRRASLLEDGPDDGED
jgi:DNA polymerase-4